jgi:lipopolysaccharide/colanic/teichoic acid biosynthesis glycosyltransferase
VKRAFDIIVALVFLVLAAPLMAGAAIGIRLTSPGPVFYRARRSGQGGAVFEMLKFRSMHVARPGAEGGAITAHGDARVFGFGRLIRKLKIDEMPQAINVLKGEMSVVGPRPEDPGIVERAYAGWMRETLDVRPGLTSPGAVWYYAMGERLITPDDPEGSYIGRVLAPKLAIERAYMERMTVWNDFATAVRTVAAVLGQVAGFTVLPARADMERALDWCPAAAFPAAGAPAAGKGGAPE